MNLIDARIISLGPINLNEYEDISFYSREALVKSWGRESITVLTYKTLDDARHQMPGDMVQI